MKIETGQHTPTPWKREGRRIKGGEYQTEAFDVSLSGKTSNIRMATVHRLNFSCFHEEDAEFIIRAVNSHDELVAIAKIMLSVMRSGDSFQLGEKGKHRALDSKVEQAIARAEGGK